MTDQKDEGFSFPTLAPTDTVVEWTNGKIVSAEPAARQKVALEKGFSQVDWLKLSRSNADLAGIGDTGLREDITLQEVAQHKTAEDAWLVLRGKVFNVGPYMRFHPGGVKILLRAAGTDATAQFDMYHRWVNADALLAKCLVGFIAQNEPKSEQKKEAPAVA